MRRKWRRSWAIGVNLDHQPGAPQEFRTPPALPFFFPGVSPPHHAGSVALVLNPKNDSAWYYPPFNEPMIDNLVRKNFAKLTIM
jgi:hypothetical protein